MRLLDDDDGEGPASGGQSLQKRSRVPTGIGTCLHTRLPTALVESARCRLFWRTGAMASVTTQSFETCLQQLVEAFPWLTVLGRCNDLACQVGGMLPVRTESCSPRAWRSLVPAMIQNVSTCKSGSGIGGVSALLWVYPHIRRAVWLDESEPMRAGLLCRRE